MTNTIRCVVVMVMFMFPMVTMEGFENFKPMREGTECKASYTKTVLKSGLGWKPKLVFPPFIQGIQQTKLASYIKKIVPTKIADNAEAMQNVIEFAKTTSEIVYGLNIATQVLGVAIPFVGATSLVLGFLSDYRSAEHTKTELLKEVNSALTLFNLGGGSFLPAGFYISYNFLSVYGMNIATQVLGVAIPFVGATSLVLGFLSDYRSAEHTKTELLKEVNSALSILTDSVNTRFDEMKIYVDESVIALEKSILDGEYQHMYNYLANCLEENDFSMRQTCMVDRCGYVKAGLPKFAIYMNSIKKTLTPTISLIKRIDANVPMLFTYITSLLIPCETILYTHKLFQATPTNVDESGQEEESKDDLGTFFSTTNKRDSKGNVVKESTGEALLEYIEMAGEKVYNALKDPEPIAQSRFVNKNKEVQCRALMSKYNVEHCDWIISEGNVNAMIKSSGKKISEIDDETRNSFCRKSLFWDPVSQTVYPPSLQDQIKAVWGSYTTDIKQLFRDLENEKKTMQQKVWELIYTTLSRDTVVNTTNINSTITDFAKNVLPNPLTFGENVTSGSQSPSSLHINATLSDFAKNVLPNPLTFGENVTSGSQSPSSLHINATLSDFAKNVLPNPLTFGENVTSGSQSPSSLHINATITDFVKTVLPKPLKFGENVTSGSQSPSSLHINSTLSDFVKTVLPKPSAYSKHLTARSQSLRGLHNNAKSGINSTMAHFVKKLLSNISTYEEDKPGRSQSTTGLHRSHSYHPRLGKRKHMRLCKRLHPRVYKHT